MFNEILFRLRTRNFKICFILFLIMNILKIEAIGFDWDGTLVDSMGIKSQSFAESIIVFYPKLEKYRREIEKLYLATRGNPRTYQLALVQKRYDLNRLSREETQRWSDLFTSLYIDKKPPLFDNTIRILDELKNRGYKLFLCSSVPQDDLDKTLKMYPLENYFELTLGTRDNGKFRKGIPHLVYVSKTIIVSLDRIAFVGDGPDDVKGANEAGCFSIGKANPKIPDSREEIQKNNPKLIIENLEELLTYFI